MSERPCALEYDFDSREPIRPWNYERLTPDDWVIAQRSEAPGSDVEVVPNEVGRGVRAINDAIEDSRRILDLGEDWDDQGSPGYQESTWRRATGFLAEMARVARTTLGLPLPVPMISPAGGGSIDLYWRDEQRSLLVNIPSDPAELGTYYGQNDLGDTTAGQLNPASARIHLVAWLAQQE